MNKGFGWKLILIIGVLLVFVYGIFGIPGGVSGSALSDALLQRIHLGLDLKGGTHLVMQVQDGESRVLAPDIYAEATFRTPPLHQRHREPNNHGNLCPDGCGPRHLGRELRDR